MSRREWTEAEVALLRARYPDELAATVAAALGRSVTQVYAKAEALGIRKSAEFLAGPMAQQLDGYRGYGTRFQKGHVPWCAGTKGVVGVADASRAHWFKPGQLSGRNAKTVLPVGAYRINSCGYLDQKVRADGPPQKRFERVHRLVWIAANGPIPEGHVVRFKDGIRRTKLEDITLDVLECIPNSEHVQRNRGPVELQRIHQLRGQITRAINRKLKENPAP